jgi:hypothetical protein
MNAITTTRRQWLAASAASAAAMLARGSAWAAGQKATASEEQAPAAGFRWVEQPDGRLALVDGERPVLTYNWGDQLKAGVPADRKRSCYVHPVCGLDGEELTDDFPKDHYHHRGLSWMWDRIQVGGRQVDLWAIKGIRQHFSRWLERRADAQGAALAVENHWITDGPPVAKETVRLQVHRADPAGRAIDVELCFEALAGIIELRGEPTKGYGGFCFRFVPREETVITTPAGKQEKDTDHQRFPWADLSARFAGRSQVSGAAVFVHAANPAAPNEWTLRHYGFLGPCWPAMEVGTLEPGKPVTLKYRVWLHRGDAAAGQVAKAYDAYRAETAKGDAK